MCRWIAYLSAEPILLDDVIRRPQLSILGQIDSHFLPGVSLQYLASDEYGASNNLTNVDGFGVGWYSEVPARYAACAEEVDEGLAELQPTVYRCDKPPHHDTNLISLCKTLDSSTIFAHLRAGSTLAVSNNHPFQFGKYLIMHNGSIANFAKIQPHILLMLSNDTRASVKGSTDSELFAALFFTFLHRSSSAWWTPITTQYLLNTLRRTIDVVLSLVSKSGGYTYSSSGEPTTWCSLNLAITSGTQLICTRFADPPEREPPSLYWSTSSGATMDRRFEGHPDGRRAESGVRLRDGKLRRERRGPHVVVASEPMTRGQDEEWHLMKSGEVLVVEEGEMEGRREGGMDATCGEAVAVAL